MLPWVAHGELTMTKATCPKNPKHKRFITSAWVSQDWEVDAEGNYLYCVNECTEVVHRPEKSNIWTCATCGAEAEVE